MKATLVRTFSSLSEPAFLAKVKTIKTRLMSAEGLVLFPDDWGDPLKDPTRVQLVAAVDLHETRYAAGLNGGHTEIIARNESRATLTALLQALAPILEDIADFDAAILSQSGFDLRRARSPAITGPLPAPQNLKLKRGNVSGTILATVRKLVGARSYDVWTCHGDPNVVANWQHAITTGGCRGIAIAGLTEGTKYYVRVRGIGSKGPGGWSNIESIIAT